MRYFTGICCGLPFLCGTAFGWGCEGHQMIGLIARAHLTPRVSAAVDRLLNENPLDPAQKRYCQDRPADPMADGAAWADDTKSVDKTFTWHFVDIPLAVHQSDVRNSDVSRWCEAIGPSLNGKDRPGCITTAIDYEWEILRDKERTGPERAKALRYVIHFLGDLSQPLHDSDNHDQGGNCTRLGFFGQEKLENLHAIWDEKIIGRDMGIRRTTQSEYAAGLDREFAKHWREWGKAKTDVKAWAWEGHDIAARVTYGKLKPRLPEADPALGQADRAACNAGRTLVQAMHISVGEEYFDETLPVIRQQLAKAGYRLAGLLNQGF
ncbi:MAG: S1/P1 nuclease [Acidobacteriota bacterium]